MKCVYGVLICAARGLQVSTQYLADEAAFNNVGHMLKIEIWIISSIDYERDQLILLHWNTRQHRSTQPFSGTLTS